MSTVRFLRTFVAVAEHGSFAAAAGQVALTQAAVSLQMRALETELRRELFDPQRPRGRAQCRRPRAAAAGAAHGRR